MAYHKQVSAACATTPATVSSISGMPADQSAPTRAPSSSAHAPAALLTWDPAGIGSMYGPAAYRAV